MIFYMYFAGHGREALADIFDAEDPFALGPKEIVKRVLTLGNSPDVGHAREEMWPTKGRVYEVEWDGQAFLVAISWDAQEISVQEVREDAYGAVE